MKINLFGECILTETDIIYGLYSGALNDLSKINIEDDQLVNEFNNSIRINADNLKKLTNYVAPNISIDDYDLINQSTWQIPHEYQNFDIAGWLLDKCATEKEQHRVTEELELFFQYEMIDVLICLKYLVDFMRKHEIVWGLGRGSSVASYCLFLIGIHKIDSIKYDLDIREFLKENNDG